MINRILEKSLSGGRVTPDEALLLFQSNDLLLLGKTAEEISYKKHPDNIVTYIVDRNINYTNICTSECSFCAFYKNINDEHAYVITKEELSKKIIETKNLGGIQVLLQGGLHPELKIDFYEDMLNFIKSFDIHIHGFSPPEIIHISKISNLTIEKVLSRLIKAGLGSIPGGGAELLVDAIRERISPNKCSSKDWLNVMELAHKKGLRSTATMMYGHLDTYKDCVSHLVRLRELQDKTSGFTAFIPWSFQEKNTKLIGNDSSGFDYLKSVSISRIVLDNFDNIQASWVTQGTKVAQVALNFGANDMGSTMIEENVVRAAGVSFKISEKQVKNIITDTGKIPKTRNTFYELL